METGDGLDHYYDQASSLQDEHLSLKRQIDFEQRIQKIDHAEQKHTFQTRYVSRIYWMISVWLAGVVGFLLHSGYQYNSFYIPEIVQVSLVTTGSANVLGLFWVVGKWLYPK
jgi:hypothetical protein